MDSSCFVYMRTLQYKFIFCCVYIQTLEGLSIRQYKGSYAPTFGLLYTICFVSYIKRFEKNLFCFCLNFSRNKESYFFKKLLCHFSGFYQESYSFCVPYIFFVHDSRKKYELLVNKLPYAFLRSF